VTQLDLSRVDIYMSVHEKDMKQRKEERALNLDYMLLALKDMGDSTTVKHVSQ